MGGDKIKIENIEIAIFIFKLLHRARGVESTDKQTDRQTDTQTDRKFFYSSCDKGLRRRFAAQTRSARDFGAFSGGPCLLQFAAARAGDPGGSFI